MTTSADPSLGSDPAGRTPRAEGAVLTRREQEILELIAFGLSNKEIAQRLGLGRRTVETHINHVLGKLDVSSRTRAVVEAGRVGLLGSAAPAAPVGPLESRPNNLPYQLTALLGREQDLMDVKILLEGTRLLTFSGSGGVGKTRLALRVGLDLIGLYPDGVWFCDFSPISDERLLPSVVAHSMGVHEQPGRSLSEVVVAWLKRRHALLIVDNCEHVLENAAELVDEILHSCPDIRILATSRQALGIMGEVVHRVSSLGLPEESAGLRADRAMRFGAIALFVDRALAADTRFTLTHDNAPVVADICRRVDGIPLAIELAATRVNVVSVQRLAQSLDDRFRVLTGGSRTALPRHKTLSALIDWSYDLLSSREQQLFERLGVFAGTFSEEAVEAVCTGSELDRAEIVDLLIGLVDKSLVVAQAAEAQERYRLLESTRAYALAKLNKSDRREMYSRRHAEHYAHQAQSADERFGVGSTKVWLADMAQDLENYRSALDWSLAGEHGVVIGGSIAGHLERMWTLAGLSGEAQQWLDVALQRVPEHTYPVVAARLWRAKARFAQGELMHDCIEKSLMLYKKVGDRRGVAHALRMLASGLLQMGRLDEANEVIEQAITALRELGDDVGVALCLSFQGLSADIRRDFAAGRTYYSQALAAFRALGDEATTASVLGNFAELEFADGHPDRALSLVSESLVLRGQGKERTDLAMDLNNSSAYSIALGRFDEARDSAQEALRLARADQNGWNASVALQHLALLAAMRGNGRAGAQLVGYVDRQLNDLGMHREATEAWVHERLMVALRGQLEETEATALSQEGAAWSEERAVQEALVV